MVSVAQSIYLLMAGVSGMLVAKLVEHHGVKKIVLLGAVMGGTCFVLLSLTTSLWYLYIMYFFLGIGLGGGAGLIPAAVIISNWFARRRGAAMLRSTQCRFLLLPLNIYLPTFPVNCPAGK